MRSLTENAITPPIPIAVIVQRERGEDADERRGQPGRGKRRASHLLQRAEPIHGLLGIDFAQRGPHLALHRGLIDRRAQQPRRRELSRLEDRPVHRRFRFLGQHGPRVTDHADDRRPLLVRC